MLSSISASNCLSCSLSAAALNLQALSLIPPVRLKRRGGKKQEEVDSCNHFAARRREVSGFRGFTGSSERGNKGSLWWRCKGFEREGDLGLEAELLEFMEKSENPMAFPTKKQLLDGGRMDLVNAISEQGGWLSWGWNAENDGGDSIAEAEPVLPKEPTNLEKDASKVFSSPSSPSSSCVDFSHMASSSCRSLEMGVQDDMGVEGILSRLEKQRNDMLTGGSEKRENNFQDTRDASVEDWLPTTPEKVFDIERRTSSNPKNSKVSDSGHNRDAGGAHTDYSSWTTTHKPDMWRTWSAQRAGNPGMDFEVGEIAFAESSIEHYTKPSKDDICSVAESHGGLDRREELIYVSEKSDHSQAQSRLQQLEAELSSVLHLLRSKPIETASQKEQSCSSDNLQKLSDVWEFQETEIMNAQGRLRSLRAKLAILEGKMALAIIDTQKTVDDKQKRINDAHKALQLLRTAYIVWPNSASEVLLTGSFDGWVTQRKMERSNTNVFSLSLKLYPGKYEIKFIVDGKWKVDPLRPIVKNNGNENNLFIVT